MRHAFSFGSQSGAAEPKSIPTRSVRAMDRKEDGGHDRPGVSVNVGVVVLLGVKEAVVVTVDEGVDVQLAEEVGVLDDVAVCVAGAEILRICEAFHSAINTLLKRSMAIDIALIDASMARPP